MFDGFDFECTLQARVPVTNHFDVQMKVHDLADMKVLLECTFGTITMVLVSL